MKQRFLDLYMDFALRTAEMSRAKRLKVGCVIVKDDNIIAYSWNGTPKSWENNCERNVFADDKANWADIDDTFPYEDVLGRRYKLETLPEVLHSETNAISKLAKSHASAEGATMFCTHAPCMDCAKMIYQAGITKLYYNETYRSTKGIEFLLEAGVVTKQYVATE